MGMISLSITDHVVRHWWCPIASSYRPVLLRALSLPCHPTTLVICNSLQACLMVHSHSNTLGKLVIIIALCFKSLLGISSCNSWESRYCWEAEDASNEGVNIHFTAWWERIEWLLIIADMGTWTSGLVHHYKVWTCICSCDSLHCIVWYDHYNKQSVLITM